MKTIAVIDDDIYIGAMLEGTLSICLTFPECRPALALPASRSID